MGLPVQDDATNGEVRSRASHQRPGPSSFPDDAYNQHGFRIERKTSPTIKVAIKAKTPQGQYGQWDFEMSPEHTVLEVKARVALMVSHRLWGGAYRVS